MAGRSECEELRVVRREVEFLHDRVKRLQSLIVMSTIIIGMAGAILGMAVQYIEDRRAVEDSVCNATYMEGYAAGYKQAVVDVAAGDLAAVLCGVNGTLTVTFDGQELVLVCRGDR